MRVARLTAWVASTSALDAATEHQPAPVIGSRSVDVTSRVLEIIPPAVVPMMRERQELGRERYGVAVHAHNGRSQAVDLLQELLDAMQYSTALSLEVDTERERDEWERVAWQLGGIAVRAAQLIEGGAMMGLPLAKAVLR